MGLLKGYPRSTVAARTVVEPQCRGAVGRGEKWLWLHGISSTEAVGPAAGSSDTRRLDSVAAMAITSALPSGRIDFWRMIATQRCHPRVSPTWRIRHRSAITREIPPRFVRTYNPRT
jgi:hypothetical protein